jgi:hypothetical protein
MKIPVDFEQKVKMPAQINGRSYPYQISAKDLMDDFRYAALQVDETPVGGLFLTEDISISGERTVKLDGEAVSGGGGSDHPWKITSNADGWSAAGGSVYSQDGGLFYADSLLNQTSTNVNVLLEIQRDSASRAITGVSLQSSQSIPASTDSYQYRVIGAIGSTTSDIFQYQFEKIRLSEELVVVNGEFKLQVYEMSHQNNYDPPA